MRSQPNPPSSPARLPWWKKAAFSAVFLLLFFTGLELGLWAIGVRPTLYDEDPYVGFSGYAPLFVEETRPDGSRILATAKNKARFFNRQEMPLRKEKGVFRVFCVGESTTYGHPYDDRTSYCRWLREFLPAADPSRKWEVINAGGISYASYRIALLVEELIRYEPDLFIIYVGHNELLERRTYSSIIELPSAVREVGGLLSQTRTYTAMKRMLQGFQAAPAAQDAGRSQLSAEVDAILDRSVGPADYTRDDALEAQVLSHYRFNMTRMLDIARSAGAAAIIVTPAANLRGFEPFKSEHRAGMAPGDLRRWGELFAGATKARAENRQEEALRLLDEAVAIDDRVADLHFARGKTLDSLGRFAEARRAFERARDEDICPLRALSPTRPILLEVAASRRVPCLDFIALVDQKSPQGIPGDDLFLDHVHPTIEGHRMLALALLDSMVQAGQARLAPTWGEAAQAELTRRIEATFDRQTQGLALKNLAKTLGWAGKYEEARKLGERAAEVLGDDAEVQLNLGDALEKQNRLEEAHTHYAEAAKLSPGYAEAWNKLGRIAEKKRNLAEAVSFYQQAVRLDPGFSRALGNLGNALSNQGKLADAVPHLEQAARLDPTNAEALQKLGVTLSKLGKSAQAEAALREAIRVQPRFARARNNLGLLLIDEKRSSEAAAQFEEALRIDPTYVQAHDNLGNLFANDGKVAGAIAHFAEVLRLDPSRSETREKLRVLAGSLEAALRARPGDAEAKRGLGVVREILGGEPRAINSPRAPAK